VRAGDRVTARVDPHGRAAPLLTEDAYAPATAYAMASGGLVLLMLGGLLLRIVVRYETDL
jgi:hypothetical protein